MAALVQYCHDQKPITEDPVANGVREAVGWDLALDDLIVVVTKDRLAGVGPSRRPDYGCVDGAEEAVAESFFLVLVPVPGVREVEVDELVVLGREGSRPALGATFGEPLLDVAPGECPCVAGFEHRCSSLRLSRPQPVDLVFVDRLTVEAGEQV